MEKKRFSNLKNVIMAGAIATSPIIASSSVIAKESTTPTQQCRDEFIIEGMIKPGAEESYETCLSNAKELEETINKKKVKKIIKDTIKFSNPPQGKFGNSKTVEEIIPSSIAKTTYDNGNMEQRLAFRFRGHYGSDWGNNSYSIEKCGDSNPIIVNGNQVTYNLVNMFKNGQSDEICVHKKELPKLEEVTLERTPGTPDIVIENKGGSTPEININHTNYSFDIDTDGIPNELKTSIDINGNPIVLSSENGNLEKIFPIDTARAEVLKAIRMYTKDESEKSASKGYTMTYGNQGESVISFLIDTNKSASENTKFPTLEELTIAIDKTANLSTRADYIINNFTTNLNGNIELKADGLKLKAYNSTFGESVPTQLIALNWIIGSAIANVVSNDYLPTTKANSSLVTARGGANAVTLEKLMRSNNLTQTGVERLNATKQMYSAQFNAAEIKVERRDF